MAWNLSTVHWVSLICVELLFYVPVEILWNDLILFDFYFYSSVKLKKGEEIKLSYSILKANIKSDSSNTIYYISSSYWLVATTFNYSLRKNDCRF